MLNIRRTVTGCLAIAALAQAVPASAATWSPAIYAGDEAFSGRLSEELEGYPQPAPLGQPGCILARQAVTDPYNHVLGYRYIHECD